MTELDEETLDEETLDRDGPSATLSSVIAEAKARLVPADRDLEASLLARIDVDIEASIEASCSPALTRVTEEARAHLVPAPRDWDAIEGRVLARAERTALRWRGLAAVAAIAAAAAGIFAFGRSSQIAWEPPAQAPISAGALGVNDGHVSVGGRAVSAGHELQVGDRLEVGAGRAVFEQAGRVTWSLEGQSRARITRVEGGLVLALEQGATEAQVVPVASGEAFAVDVADSAGHVARVAVHGTHLRVARSADHVTIDLTEGVVIVGRAPRAGSTFGALVTAPAHVELDVSQPEALRVDHELGSVRRAAVLAFAEEPRESQRAPRVALGGPWVAPEDKPTNAASERPLTHAPRAAVEVPRPTNAPDPTPATDPDPRARIESAARACFAEGAQQKDGLEVHVTASTVLEFTVGDDGKVHTLHFTTPLSKYTQECVGRAVWSLRFPEGTSSMSIPLELSR